MKKFFTAVAGVALTLPVFATPLNGLAQQESRYFPYMPKAKVIGQRNTFGDVSNLESFQNRHKKSEVKVSAASDFINLPKSQMCGYLEAPNGDTWFYVGNYSYNESNQINGFSIDVYDSSYALIGSVRDDIALHGDEIRIADVSIGTTITQKFFNYDQKYEIMIGVAANNANYVIKTRTNVYAIDKLDEGAKSECLTEIDGYYCSAINTAQDAWSEQFYITFMTTTSDTTTPELNGVENTTDYKFVTYKKASGGEIQQLFEVRFPEIAIAGPHAVPIQVAQKDGVPYFAINYLKYSWYENPYDYNNEAPTPNNELIVDIYTVGSGWSSTAEHYSTTRFPLNATEDNIYYIYTGAFQYDKDLNLTLNQDGTPALYLTRAHSQQGGDYYTFDYEVYDAAPKGTDAQAVKKFDIAKEVEGGIIMNDVKGFDPQAMCAYLDGGIYRFRFVNLNTGELEHLISYGFNDDSELYNMNIDVNRIAYGDSYVYVVPQQKGIIADNDDVHTQIVFASPEGDIIKVDDINMGPNVDNAMIFNAVEAYNPYLFNIDDNREYMVLIKRSLPDGGNQEEFLLVSPDPSVGTLLNVGPDDEKGIISTVFLMNPTKDNPSLIVSYVDRVTGNWQYTNTCISLPLQTYTNGDGTAENPYQINSVGGLMQIKSNPNAHYILVNDIDASGATIANSKFTFTGSFDGQNHVISNLNISGRALFPSIQGNTTGENENETEELRARQSSENSERQAGSVQNVKFNNVTFDATVDEQGLIAGTVVGGLIRNVHVYNGTINAETDAAGIAANVSLYSVIEQCSFNGDINVGGSAAGIARYLLTSATVKACAFSGSINGAQNIGGIVGELSNNAGVVVDCHVDADIIGKNYIGGIVGSACRTLIARNHVQGTLTATENLSWGGGPQIGGIAGAVAMYPEEAEGATTEPVITNNFVNLTSITIPETEQGKYAAQNNTAHRVVGYTRANYADPTGYDDNWNEIYGDPMIADKGIINNYVISTLAKVDDSIADDVNSTEGKSIDVSELGMGFFMETLQFSYGYETSAPWSYTGDFTSPSLFFETGLLTITPATATVEVGSEATMVVELVGKEFTEDMIGGFTMEYSEDLLESTNMELTEDGKGIRLTFKAIKAGQAYVSVNLNGAEAKANIEVIEAVDAIENVTADDNVLTFDGQTLSADQCVINVYNVAGCKVISGMSNVNVSTLSAGIYVVTADANNGKRYTLKIRK